MQRYKAVGFPGTVASSLAIPKSTVLACLSFDSRRSNLCLGAAVYALPERIVPSMHSQASDAIIAPSTQSAPVQSILEAIGNTPLMRVDGIWAKLEFLNPSGSVKARIAKYIVERAEHEGLLKPGDTIIEASSGNTGNAFSMVAAAKGYRMLVVMPRGMSRERVAISKAFGAEVLLVGDFHVNEALAKAQELGKQAGFFYPNQFASAWNVEENYRWLGQEILRQLPENLIPDALVVGIGTGGTLIGVGQALRERNPAIKLFGVEPDESCTIACGEVGKHLVEGIADGFVPEIVARHREMIDGFISVKSQESIKEMRHLARYYGMFVGPSSGAHLLAAKRVQQAHPELSNIVTVFCDEGEKYLSEHFLERALAQEGQQHIGE